MSPCSRHRAATTPMPPDSLHSFAQTRQPQACRRTAAGSAASLPCLAGRCRRSPSSPEHHLAARCRTRIAPRAKTCLQGHPPRVATRPVPGHRRAQAPRPARSRRHRREACSPASGLIARRRPKRAEGSRSGGEESGSAPPELGRAARPRALAPPHLDARGPCQSKNAPPSPSSPAAGLRRGREGDNFGNFGTRSSFCNGTVKFVPSYRRESSEFLTESKFSQISKMC